MEPARIARYSPMLENMLVTYQGEALSWEADDLGHMNMRYYFERAEQARSVFMAHLGLADTAKRGAMSTVIPTRLHIKYLKELRPGQAIIVQSGILAMDEDTMQILHVLSSYGKASASITETISHISTRTQNPFPWNRKTKASAKAHMCSAPDFAVPRNLDPALNLTAPDITRAETYGLSPISVGRFKNEECDSAGFVQTHVFIGRVSDGAQTVKTVWDDVEFGVDGRYSGAMLEAIIVPYNRPLAGDIYKVSSGLVEANPYTRTVLHWMYDPVSGAPYAALVGCACRFDLQERRLVKSDEKTMAMLRAGLTKAAPDYARGSI